MTSPREDRAARVTRSLAERFLAAGRYTFAPVTPAWATTHTAAAGDAELEQSLLEGGFFSLSVQAVGYEVGVEDPKVHIYVTKGPRKAEEELSDPEGDVQIEINRVGRVVVRPEAASGSTTAGNVFTRNGRIACGSSCAPAGETYSGTLGALACKRGRPEIYALSNNHVLAAANHAPIGMPILSPSNA